MSLSQLLTEIRQTVGAKNDVLDDFHVEGLKLRFQTQQQTICDFVKQTLAPVDLDDGSQSAVTWQLSVRCDPVLLSSVLTEIDRQNLEWTSVPIRRMSIRRYAITADQDICVRKSRGVLWLIDRSQKTIHMITSGQTQYPLLTARNLARDLIVSYLHDNGWTTLHAGAVRLGEKNYLVVGDGGQGKTSLILALMATGAKFIANERTLLKKDGAKVRAISFPMSVAVGLGSALNFHSLANLCSKPEQLLLPQTRLQVNKLQQVPISEWKNLKDKILMLPGELCRALNTQPHIGESTIDGILVPKLDEAHQFRAQSLSKNDLSGLLQRNVITRKKETLYPDWMPLGYSHDSAQSDQICSALEKLPASRIQFYKIGKSTLPRQIATLRGELN